MQYRIYWKYKDGGRYATEAELSNMLLRFDGQVVEVEWHEQDERCYFDSGITDQVVVEYKIGVKDDLNGKHDSGVDIYQNDMVLLTQYPNSKNESGPELLQVVWQSKISGWSLFQPENKAKGRDDHWIPFWLLPNDCILKVVGTVHDESEANK